MNQIELNCLNTDLGDNAEQFVDNEIVASNNKNH